MTGDGLFSQSSWTKISVTDKKRIFFWVLILWLPPVLSILLGRTSIEATPQIEIFQDFAFHVRCLIAVPILLIFEKMIFKATNNVIPDAVQRGIITSGQKEDIDKFRTRIYRIQNSWAFEIFLLLLSIFYVSNHLYIDLPGETSSWRTMIAPSYVFANWWNKWIGLTIYYFFILRWIFRFLFWCSFLLKLALSKLNLQNLHPDQRGGISFLFERHLLFALIATAISSVGSANIASVVMYGNLALETFYLPLGLYLFVIIFIITFPLFIFTPLLLHEKKKGKHEYGDMAYSYAEYFESKWLIRKDLKEKELLGTPDLQSLNDLMRSYSQLKEMRILPVSHREFLILLVRIGIPLLPLVLFKIPVSELFRLILKRIL